MTLPKEDANGDVWTGGEAGTDWATVARLADTVPVETAAGALARTEAAMTDENDCSTFDLVIAGGADPVRVRVTPDELRATLAALRSSVSHP